MPTIEPNDQAQNWRVRAWNDEAVERRFLKEDLIQSVGQKCPTYRNGRETSQSSGY